MASSKDYLDYIIDLIDDYRISYKKMMGEYLLYFDGILFGGIYDDRFLVKETESLMDHNLQEEIPYPNAKPMYMVDAENKEEIMDIILKTVEGLKNK